MVGLEVEVVFGVEGLEEGPDLGGGGVGMSPELDHMVMRW